MFRSTLFSLICFGVNIASFASERRVLCASEMKLCVCRHVHDVNKDFLLVKVDCTFTDSKILETNYSLPISVHSLTLSSNNISDVIKTNLLQSQTMEMLSLSKNNIFNIEANAFNLPNLTHLDISDNRLEHIDPEIFRNFNSLIYLNLALNKFTTFPTMTFHHLRYLKEIILDDNNIGKAMTETSLFHRNGFALNSAIKNVSIAGINLESVPENMFADAYDIRFLKISNNNIKDMPELPFTLEYLDISDNPISEIDFVDFSNVPALKELRLNNLHIKQVSEFVFEPLKVLKKLELERNLNLTYFSALAFGNEVLDDADDFSLEFLSLQGSRLTTLCEELAIPFGQLVKLDLQGNPWKCDCKILWLKQLQIPPNDYDHLRCYLPVSLNNKRIFELEGKKFKCKASLGITLVSIAVVAFCLIFATMAIWFFVFIPRYQSRGHFIQTFTYPTASFLPIPINQAPVDGTTLF